MSKNADIFRRHLEEIDVYMEEGKNENGSTFFRTEQRLKNGGAVVLAVGFNIDEDLVDIYVFDIADINDAYKKESALKLINELNRDFRYSKFTLEESGSITSSYSILFEDNFNPNIVVRQLLLALNAVEEIYPKFMKIAWA